MIRDGEFAPSATMLPTASRFLDCDTISDMTNPAHTANYAKRNRILALVGVLMMTAVPLVLFAAAETFYGALPIKGSCNSFELGDSAPPPTPSLFERLDVDESESAWHFASMDSPFFRYSDGWTVSTSGAQPPEPADPEATPSGTIDFDYRGRLLFFQINPGDYRGHFYVTVDGQPANQLVPSRRHEPVVEPPAGYRPLYMPERAGYIDPICVHVSDDAEQLHHVTMTMWRSWGETPITGIGIRSSVPTSLPSTILLLPIVIGIWLVAPWTLGVARLFAYMPRRNARLARAAQTLLGAEIQLGAAFVAAVAFVAAALGVWLSVWWLCAGGVAILALAALVRPALWYSAFLFALPFYYSFDLPLLPNRSIGMVDVGTWIGIAVAAVYTLIAITATGESSSANGLTLVPIRDENERRGPRTPMSKWPLILLAAIASWALISAFDAQYGDIALREWRTVFLAALVVAAGLTLTVRFTFRPAREVAILVGGWLLGATLFAALALWLYPDPSVIIPAEGVQRLRGFYGSPNNLALYLERTLAVTLALLLFLRDWRSRIAAGVAALVQLAAFLLTFSKGGLFLALPVMGIVLWGAGYYTLRREGRSTRVLWALAGVAALVVLATLPFLGTERFARIIDLGTGTGFLRVNLWRAAWQMALDHPWLGVGPDGFLYAYRSQYIFPQAWMEPNLNHPHNWLLDWWTRLGIPGLLLGLAFWGTILWNCVQNLRRGWGWSALTIGILAATAAALAHGLIDLSYALPDLMIVWAFFAVLSSIRVQSKTL